MDDDVHDELQDLREWERQSCGGVWLRMRPSSKGLRIETSWLRAVDAERIPKFVQREDHHCEWSGPAREAGDRLREVATMFAKKFGGR